MPAAISARKRKALDKKTKKRIAELQTKSVPLRTREEDLDAPLDPGLRTSTRTPALKGLGLYRDGERVSHTALWVHEQQVGSARLRMGGVGGVATPPEHRFKGYSRLVMDNALQWMRQNEYDVAMLFGILSFYPKFGYAVAFPRTQGSLALEYALQVPKGTYRFVRYQDKHLRECLRVYHAMIRGRVGPVRRKASTWRPWRQGLSWGAQAEAWIALDASGKFSGYLVFDKRPEALSVIEAGFKDPRAIPDALHKAAAFSQKQGLDHIRFCLPEDDLLIEYCKPLGLRLERVYHRDGQGMIRLINTRSTLTKLADDLAPRLPGRGALNLHTNLDAVALVWGKQGVSVQSPKKGAPSVRLPQWALAQMIYGFTTASAHAVAGHCQGAQKSIELLDHLFPVRPHFFYAVDGF